MFCHLMLVGVTLCYDDILLPMHCGWICRQYSLNVSCTMVTSWYSVHKGNFEGIKLNLNAKMNEYDEILYFQWMNCKCDKIKYAPKCFFKNWQNIFEKLDGWIIQLDLHAIGPYFSYVMHNLSVQLVVNFLRFQENLIVVLLPFLLEWYL